VYVYDGFCTLLVSPSPKFQSHEVGELEDASVNWTTSGAAPDVGVAVKLATGTVAVEVTVIVVV